MILNNFMSFLSNKKGLNVGGTFSALQHSNLVQTLSRSWNYPMSKVSYTGSSSNYGFGSVLVLGTNNSDVRPDDYKIHLIDETYIKYVSQTIQPYNIEEDPTFSSRWQISRMIEYSSEATEELTVNELGLYARYCNDNSTGSVHTKQTGDATDPNTNSSLGYIFLLVREKLETPVVLKPGDIYTFVLTIK